MLINGLLLFLPAVALASIDISLEVNKDKDKNKIEFRGEAVNIITDEEQRTFGITDGPLKDAVKAAYGERPTDVFVRSPTPWDDLYSSYGWPQVQRTLKPVRATILGVHSQPTIVATRSFINRNENIEGTFDTSISQGVDQTVTNTWTETTTIGSGVSISYSVKFPGEELGGSTSIDFSTSFGKDSTKSETVSVGSSDGVKVVLKPGQSVTASLLATRGTMEVEVEYEATLSGWVACNFAGRFQGHYFWGYDINTVMEAAGIPKVKKSKEIIKIGFYSDGEIVLN